MAVFDATESLTPFRAGGDGNGYGAILFDIAHLRQVEPEWFVPAHWGDHARPVHSGGRGGAWFIHAPFGDVVLRQYLRGGLAARISRDGYLWRSADRTRSFAEFRLTRQLHQRGLPVPRPIAACYVREGYRYRAAILVERIVAARSFADCVSSAGSDAPWQETGRLVAQFHRAGLDHADLNAHNILFDARTQGWLIDFDKGELRIPATRWRERNLARLRRSLAKLQKPRAAALERDFARLRTAYDAAWERGI